MILVDTSAWIEYLRATGSAQHHAVRQLIVNDADIATTEIVVMELLAGARGERHLDQLRRLVGRCRLVPMEGLADFEAAAALFRTCRQAGTTIRALTDCMIAAVAIRAEMRVLHRDRDFAHLAEHTELQLVPDDDLDVGR